MSSSNSVLITAIEEATYGVTPATGSFKTARYVSESLSGTPQTAKSTEIHSDRTSSGQVQVGLDVAGDINEELSADSLQQDFIRAAMMKDKPEPEAVMTGKAITVKAIDKTFAVEGAANLAKGDLIFMSGFTDEKNNGMAYVNSAVGSEVSPAVPVGKAVIITATPSAGTELAWTFAAAGGVTGTWSYGESTTDTSGAYTYSAAGTYSVKFTAANGVASHLSLNVVALADSPVAQTSTEEVAYKPIITATPSADTDLVFSFALDNPTAGTFAFADGDPATIEAGASASHTFAAAGTYAVTFTNANGDQSNLSLTVAVAFAENVTQTGVQQESQPAQLAVNKFTITVGKETIADETSPTTASVKKATKLSVGSDLISFSICKQFTELSEKSIDYLGMLVNSMELTMQHGSIATAVFGFMGNGYDNSADTLMTDGHIIEPASTVQPLNATSDISGVFIDGKIADFCLQSLKINLTNGLTPQVCLGRLAPRTYALGTAAVDVSGSAYIADANWNLLEKKLTQQPVSIAFAAENQDGGIAVIVHGAQLSFVDPSASGMDQTVSIDFSGSASNTENGYLDIYYW
jgi:hypothetical protein